MALRTTLLLSCMTLALLGCAGNDHPAPPRTQQVDLLTALPDKLLVKVDRSLMAFGVEARVPYLDHRIVEFGLTLPDALKVQGRTGKVFLRQWGQRHVPREHLMQGKQGFHVPMAQVLDEPLLRALGPALAGNRALRQWFDADGLRQLVEAQRQSGGLSELVWGVMQFAIWHRIFIERGGARPTLDEDPLDWIR